MTRPMSRTWRRWRRITPAERESAHVRNSSLHSVLETFTADAAAQLDAEAAGGAEIPFELIETERGPRGRVPLYCYRPLTSTFIRQQLGVLVALPSYAPAARALASLDGTERYLRERGEPRVPEDARERADATLRSFLSCVFEERSEFGFDQARFEAAYAVLEHALYDGHSITTVIAPLLGIALSSNEVPLGEGLSLTRGDSVENAPAEAVWGDGDEPHVLVVLTVTQELGDRPPLSLARQRFRRVLTALRLFERGGYALGPVAWSRTDAGSWRVVPLGGSGRPRFVTEIAADGEDELRAFCNLVSRRMPGGGELAWALARFEMGCERLAPFEALTDYLLALRALLEPEGPGSGRLAGRLAAICAQPAERAALAERVAHGISLERAVIAGLAPGDTDPAHPVDALVDELSEHLRALLRDVLCGHLDSDLRTVADRILAEAATAKEAAETLG